jgi:hypothetical protein
MTLHLSQIFFTEARTFICHFLVHPTMPIKQCSSSHVRQTMFVLRPTRPEPNHALLPPPAAPQTSRRNRLLAQTRKRPQVLVDSGGLRKLFRYL